MSEIYSINCGDVVYLNSTKQFKKIHGKYSVKGYLFENNDDNLYLDTECIVYDLYNKELFRYKSDNGYFDIKNLPNKVNIAILDSSKKYVGKYLSNIDLDTGKHIEILKMYLNKNYGLFYIKYNGDSNKLSIFSSRCDITRIDDNFFKVDNITDTLIDINVNDYVDDEIIYYNERFKVS